MGEIAEYYMDQDLQQMDFSDVPSHSKGTTWTTAAGKMISVKAMTDSHLLNCIHLCEKREGDKGVEFLNDAPTYQTMVKELISRGKLKYAYFDLSVQERLLVKL